MASETRLQPIQVYVSYSHKDEALRDQLATHLKVMRRQALIQTWTDREITAGEEWKGAIDEHLNSADIILLLVSPDFLASDYCFDVGMIRALERHEKGEARVIPIIIRPVDWMNTPFSKLQALPRHGKPVTAWPDRDRAWLDIIEGIQSVIAHIEKSEVTERQAAQETLLALAIQELREVDGLEKMVRAGQVLHSLSISENALRAGLDKARSYVNAVSDLTQGYLTRMTLIGQSSALEGIRQELEFFRDAMAEVKPPVGPDFQQIANRWLEIVVRAEEECRKKLAFTPIPNPFVAGNPLKPDDHHLFKGRKDIRVAIEENIIIPSQRPALLLYGRRRTGKTSTLLNLPRLLSSDFMPVFIDCQNAKWREGDAAFCYHLASNVYGELYRRKLFDGLSKPALEQFERYAFTRLDEILDQVEALSRRINKQILLTFDEYERLEEGFAAQKITCEVFNQLRNIVQHRARLVVLFSGSHRFEELRVVNWSDYLINVKTLELSFLAPEDARELLTEPVPALHYEPGVVDKIIALTHCQPYLLQAVASDLVNYLNAQKRQTATMADLDVAVAKVLVTADAYFHNNWEECAEAEREVLRALATGAADTAAMPQYQVAVQSLSRKEIVEMRDNQYRFAVELFRLWVLKNHCFNEARS